MDKQNSEYTFKYNRKLRRHGWLRLTPAYSVKLVTELFGDMPADTLVLDPFSGTATTGLVAVEHGLSAHLLDINPFLVWFGNIKCWHYGSVDRKSFNTGLDQVFERMQIHLQQDNWIPAIHNVERWWCRQTLTNLAALRVALVEVFGEPPISGVGALAWVAFCRLVIETSAAAFNHVSMSFSDDVNFYESGQIIGLYRCLCETISEFAWQPLSGNAEVFYGDACHVPDIGGARYTHVITSPPYPNRVSYIRELRPYMYWLGFIKQAKQAGELDWQAIGGTWGSATSRLLAWEPIRDDLPERLLEAVRQISKADNVSAHLMAQYVHKYFHDMHIHFDSLRQVLASQARLSYVVGNSTFYGVSVDTQLVFEESLKQLDYTDVKSFTVRKRNSKKALYEYCINATW